MRCASSTPNSASRRCLRNCPRRSPPLRPRSIPSAWIRPRRSAIFLPACQRKTKSPCGSNPRPANAKPKASARASPPSNFRPRPASRARRGGMNRAKWPALSRRFWPTPRGRKSCTIPSSSNCWPALSREFATRRCSIPICCGPPRRSTISPTSFCGIATSRCRAHPANAPISCSFSRQCSPRKSSAPVSPNFTARSICRWRRCWPRWSGSAFTSIRARSKRCPRKWSARFVRSNARFGIWPAASST